MANILSQSEIDELLNAINSGEDVEENKEDQEQHTGLRVYDFRTANKFSKEQIKTLDIIFDNYSYLLSTRLTGVLRTVCEVEVSSVEEQKFGEFNNSIPSPAVIGIVDVEPFQGPILMEISPSLAYAIVSRIFGGNAEGENVSKSFTEIELVVLENILKQFISYLRESWEKIVEISPSLDRIETSSQFTQITALSEPSAIITFTVKIDQVEDMISICIPHVVLQPVIKKLTSAAWTLNSSVRALSVENKEDILSEELNDTNCTLSAVLNASTSTLNELYHMRVGDIICLNHNINDYITINMEGVPKFQGVAGISGNKKVVQIAKMIKESKDIE